MAPLLSLGGRAVARWLAVLVVLTACAGCGRRGALEAPPDASINPGAAGPAGQNKTGPKTSSSSRSSAVVTETVPVPSSIATGPGIAVADTVDSDDDVEDSDPAQAVLASPNPSANRKRSRTFVVPKEPFFLDPLL